MPVNVGPTGNRRNIRYPVVFLAQCECWCSVTVGQMAQQLTSRTALLIAFYSGLTVKRTYSSLFMPARSKCTEPTHHRCLCYTCKTIDDICLWISADWHPFSPINQTTDLWSYLDMFSTWCAIFNVLELELNVRVILSTSERKWELHKRGRNWWWPVGTCGVLSITVHWDLLVLGIKGLSCPVDNLVRTS